MKTIMRRIAAVFAALIIIGSGGCSKGTDSTDQSPADNTVCAPVVNGCIPVGTGPAMIGDHPVPFGMHCNENQVIAVWQNNDMSYSSQCINYGDL
jgi:hypothetical protein